LRAAFRLIEEDNILMSDHSYKNRLIQADAEEKADGWAGSFAIFTDPGDKTLLYWMPEMAHLFASEAGAQRAALAAAKQHVDTLAYGAAG
jgi:hypothetical protein